MQTFLPLPDLLASIRCLDYRRLGKQRLEAKQLIECLEGRSNGWANHPACKMWRNHVPALGLYMNLCIDEWSSRGYKNTMQHYWLDSIPPMPLWFGRGDFHASHRSNLLRKDPEHYGQFGWTEPDNLEYVWPV